MPVFKSVNKNFFKKWSPEMAYILGFFAADGYITVNRRGGQFLCIDIADEQLIKTIKKTIKAEHKISTRLRKKGETIFVSYRLQIGSIEICNDLRRLGFNTGKTKSLAIPNIPEKYFSNFVRGYFDGDGNVWSGYNNKERETPTHALAIGFTSCSHVFLQNLKEKLANLIQLKGGSLFASKKKNYSRLQYSTCNALKLADFMYNGLGTSTLFLKRKRDVFDKYRK